MIKLEEFGAILLKLEEQTGEILGVAKFSNLQISQVAKFANLRNSAGCEFSQVSNFRNLSPVTHMSPDCFLTHLLMV